MPASVPPIAILLAATLLAACRPGDAPKEPTEPTEPTVSHVDDATGGGTSPVLARRGLALARL